MAAVNSAADIAQALIEIRGGLQSLDQRVNASEARATQVIQNIQALDARLTTHESIHDPYIQVTDRRFSKFGHPIRWTSQIPEKRGHLLFTNTPDDPAYDFASVKKQDTPIFY